MDKIKMRKTIIMALLLMIITAVSAAAFSGSGAGTVGDPYIITDAFELNETKDDLSASYALGADIDMNVDPFNTGNGFVPSIGDWNDLPFTGTFDGRGYTISNLYMSYPNDDYALGLFGYIEDTTIENIRLTNATMDGGYGAILIGYSDASVGVTVSNVSIEGYAFSDTNEVAAICVDCGGAGTVYNFSRVSFVGDLNTTANTYSSSTNGGLFSYLSGGNFTISESYFIGDMYVNGYHASAITTFGGIIGRAAGPDISIYDSFVRGDVTCISNVTCYVAGIVGRVTSGAVYAEDVYYVGDVTSQAVTNNYYGADVGTGTFTCATSYYAGDIEPVAACFTNSTSSAMGVIGTYSGWDFVDTWTLGDTYPELVWNYVAPETPPETPAEGYTPTYSSSDLDNLVVDSLGTAGEEAVNWIPLIILLGVVGLGAGFYTAVWKKFKG